MKRMITSGQKKAIWTMIRKSGLDEDDFREWLGREFHTKSTRELTESAAAEVINALKTLTGQQYTPHLRTWGITSKQMGMVRGLAYEIGWDDSRRIDGLVAKMFEPKNRLELLNKTEGSKLIVALEKMKGEVERGERTYA